MDLKDKLDFKLFFIIARGRSGTTLLNVILNQHPDIFIPQESPFIMNLYSKYGRKNVVWDEKTREQFYKDLWKEIRLLQYWKLQNRAEQLKADILALDDELANFNNFCRLVFYHQAVNRGKPNAKVIGDKNPSYTLYIPELSKIFPEATYVFMIRDPRDNILSYKQITLDFFNETSFLAQRWTLFNKDVASYIKRSNTQNHLLTLESLLTNSENELKKLSDILGVEYTSNFLTFYKSDEQLESWFFFDKKPIDPTQIDKWKSKISVSDRKKVEAICGELANEFGYEITQKDSLSFQQKIWMLPTRILGWMAYIFEDKIYYLPIGLKSFIIDNYRKLTKTLPGRDSEKLSAKNS